MSALSQRTLVAVRTLQDRERLLPSRGNSTRQS